jgi:hypothetical protein
MKTYAVVLALSLFIFPPALDDGLARGATTASAPATATAPATTATAAARMSVADATDAVRRQVFRDQPAMNPTAQFPLSEITTADMWTRLQAQVFLVTSGVKAGNVYLIREQSATLLVGAFGANGITSSCVADLDGDGKAEMLFTYGYGSGLHYSAVGIWSAAGALRSRVALPDYDLALQKTDDQHVRVTYSAFPPGARPAPAAELGSLRVTTNPAPALDLTPSAALPANIAARITTAP